VLQASSLVGSKERANMTSKVINNVTNAGLCNPQYSDYYYNPGGCTVYSEALTINIIFLLKPFLLPTDAHNVKKHRVIKTF